MFFNRENGIEVFNTNTFKLLEGQRGGGRPSTLVGEASISEIWQSCSYYLPLPMWDNRLKVTSEVSSPIVNFCETMSSQ